MGLMGNALLLRSVLVEYATQQTPELSSPPRREWFNELLRERLGERPFYALAAAIRDHEAAAHEQGGELSDHDRELYAKLRLICGEL
jgi:hypothetical protein